MGKEATIGLAVILILLITFGVVLVRRLGGSEDPAAEAAVGQDEKDSARAGEDPAVKDSEFPAVGPNKLRVLEPASSQTTYYSPASAGQLIEASDGETKVQDVYAGATQVSAPPSVPMPDPPVPARVDPYDRNGSGVQQTQASQARQMYPGGDSIPAAHSQAYDPFRGQTAQMGAANVQPIGPASGRLRSLGPPQPTPRQPGTDSYDYPDTVGDTADGSATAQAPAWRQPQRYPYSTPSQQAQIGPHPESDSNLGSLYAAKSLLGANGDYQVQPNDSYWGISQKLYGSGAYFKALAEHNLRKVPRQDRLAVGEVISAPSVSELEKAYPDLCPKPSRRETVRNRASLTGARTPYVGGRIYVVEEGDTLFDIARYELGKASRWVEIHQLNRDLVGDDADYIAPGMRLVLPDDKPGERLTQRPGSTY